jgi:hypothetical protein
LKFDLMAPCIGDIMLTLKTRSKVAADGTVTVPVGAKEAGVEVDVTITPVHGKMAKA